jgi:hypothetical protein
MDDRHLGYITKLKKKIIIRNLLKKLVFNSQESESLKNIF